MNRQIILIILTVFCIAISGFTAEEISPLAIGEKAPDFRLIGVDDKYYTLSDFSDSKVFCIIFTCNHCPTAQGFEDEIIDIVNDYKSKDVAFVGISPNDPQSVRLNECGYTDLSDSFEEMKIRAKYKKYNFPYLYDGDSQKFSKEYGPKATPHAFVFDKDRKLRYRGRICEGENPAKTKSHDLRNALTAVLEGKAVEPEITIPRGCSIKWGGKKEQVDAYMKKLAEEPVTLQTIDADGVKEIVANSSENYRIINLWATWCNPCVEEFPELVTINRMYRHRQVEFITISVDTVKDQEKVLAFLKKQQASNRNYLYSSTDFDQLAKALDPKFEGGIPHTILVKPGGEIVYRHSGQIDPLELKRAIVDHIGRTYFHVRK
jgi:thiol-disulfide isomerase/thioredoxin